jgi:hypothetical protein
MEISNPSSPRSLSISSSRLPLQSPSIFSLPSRRSRRADRPRRSTRRSSLASSPRRASSRSSSVESSSAPPPLPASSLAYFLATQYLSDDPAQTLLELVRHAPGAQPLLVETLTQRQNAPPAPEPADSMGLQAGLEHIKSHFPADKQLPDMISNPSIEKPTVEYTPEEL